MRIYTRTGDRGQTGLFGGKRVSKASVRLHAYGTIDELAAVIGVALSSQAGLSSRAQSRDDPTNEHLGIIQSLLFTLGADLATPQQSKAKTARITQAHIDQLERWIDEMEEELPPLQNFILPGGSQAGANLHVARTVCRRAERWIVELEQSEKINDLILPFVNRLSDYLFVVARSVNQAEEMPEEIVTAERNG